MFSLFRSSVRSFVRMYVPSFVFPSQGQSFCVKVYKTSYFEDPLMNFIHIWHNGRYRSRSRTWPAVVQLLVFIYSGIQ